MLEHWIQPLQNPILNHDFLDADRLGAQVITTSDHQARPDVRAVALIGVDGRWTRLVRRHLYQFAYKMSSDVRIFDYGDMRRSDPDFIIGPIFELISGGICPVLVGAPLPALRSLGQCFQHLRISFRPAVLHETIPDFLPEAAEHAFVIGIQQHLVPKNTPDHLQTLHLSEVRNSITDAETLIRQSNVCVADAAAVSASEMPAQLSVSSSGFCTEEACMLMRFAGLHAGTKLLMLTGHDPRSLHLDISANTAAQMVWYFLEGFSQCVVEDPLTSMHCTSYVVHLDQYDTGFKFYKSERTGRWWVQIQAAENEKLFPCTYRDYLQATNGQVSDHLIQFANASLERSKHTL